MRQPNIEDLLDLFCKAAWGRASIRERRALQQAANISSETSPVEVFSSIARQAGSIDPILTTLLWSELAPQRRITRIELGDVQLSEESSEAMQLALAYELGQRIDRVVAELGGVRNASMTQEDLEEKSKAAGVQWQAVAYALSREREGQG